MAVAVRDRGRPAVAHFPLAGSASFCAGFRDEPQPAIDAEPVADVVELNEIQPGPARIKCQVSVDPVDARNETPVRELEVVLRVVQTESELRRRPPIKAQIREGQLAVVVIPNADAQPPTDFPLVAGAKPELIAGKLVNPGRDGQPVYNLERLGDALVLWECAEAEGVALMTDEISPSQG